MTSSDLSIESLFLKKKPMEILYALKQTESEEERFYALKLARAADTTYSHAVRILDKMESLNLVKFERDGRKKIVELTELGSMLAEDLMKFRQRARSEI